MNKICTTIEQSKKLMELGIDVNTADMIYQPIMNIAYEQCGFDKIPLCFPFSEVKECNIQYLPAWSLTALLELMPKIGANEPKLCKRYYVDTPLIRYVCTYGLLKDTKEYDNPVDACYEMVCWLNVKI